jgi:hypothetical protein
MNRKNIQQSPLGKSTDYFLSSLSPNLQLEGIDLKAAYSAFIKAYMRTCGTYPGVGNGSKVRNTKE